MSRRTCVIVKQMQSNNMAVKDIGRLGSRISSAMILIKFWQNMPVSAAEGPMLVVNFMKAYEETLVVFSSEMMLNCIIQNKEHFIAAKLHLLLQSQWNLQCFKLKFALSRPEMSRKFPSLYNLYYKFYLPRVKFNWSSPIFGRQEWLCDH